jgi:DNA mismatch endonuclease (patch repair protein)
MDVHTREQRRANMSAIRGRDTKPEMVVRRLVHSMGFRYSLHSSKLPGRPDLVFTKRRRIILVHGCYWHMHACRFGQVVPKTNAVFWRKKRLGNVERDRLVLKSLRQMGFRVLVVWECQTRDTDRIAGKLGTFMTSERRSPK